jgi:hypothetical protein
MREKYTPLSREGVAKAGSSQPDGLGVGDSGADEGDGGEIQRLRDQAVKDSHNSWKTAEQHRCGRADGGAVSENPGQPEPQVIIYQEGKSSDSLQLKT